MDLLGLFVTIYVKDKNKINEVMAYIKTLKGVEMVIDKDESIKKLKQPKDRIGDIVVTSNEKFAIEKRE